MKISPEKSLQKNLQVKECFFKDSALKEPIGSLPENFKTGCCFMGVLGARVIYLLENFKSAIISLVQNKQILWEFYKSLSGCSFENDNIKKVHIKDMNSDLGDCVFKSYLKIVSISYLFTFEDFHDVLRLYSAKINREELANSITLKF